MSAQVYCSYADCQEDWNEKSPACLCGESDYKKCGNYLGALEKTETAAEPTAEEELEDIVLPWSSSSLGSTDLEYISAIQHPYIIGVIGQAKSGKTTFLATLYMLLRSGKTIAGYTFAGSYTLLGWEKIAQFLTFNTHKKITFPPHTSANMARVPGLLHLLLKDEDGIYKDIILTDAPGEWFTEWAKSAEDHAAMGAKWIDDVADAFIMVADCTAFKANVGKERHVLLQIVERMKNTHNMRPIALAWTKSDQDLSQEVKERIFVKVAAQLPNVRAYELAVINRKSDKEIDDILVLIGSLLEESQTKRSSITEPSIKSEDDFFFTIR